MYAVFNEIVMRVPSSVGCIAFTYIMLNVDPERTPVAYLMERVIGTFAGVAAISLVITYIMHSLIKKR